MAQMGQKVAEATEQLRIEEERELELERKRSIEALEKEKAFGETREKVVGQETSHAGKECCFFFHYEYRFQEFGGVLLLLHLLLLHGTEYKNDTHYARTILGLKWVTYMRVYTYRYECNGTTLSRQAMDVNIFVGKCGI
jgi:hypothetical protein